MSRKSRRIFVKLALAFSLCLVAMQSQNAFAQIKRTFDNSGTPTPGTEAYFDGSGWTAGKWAGAVSPIGDIIPDGQGLTNDLGFFGNPSTVVDSPITLSTGTYSALSLGGWSFNSTNTAYSLQAQGLGSSMDVTLNGLNINTSNGEVVSGTGSRILVLSDLSQQNVSIGVSSPQALNLILGATQGEIYVTASRTMSVGSVISGAAKGITKTGDGILLLSGANTYTGETIVSGGVLRSTANDRLASGALTVNGNNAVFDLQGFTDTVGVVSLKNGTLSGSGTLTGTSYAFESGTASLRLAGATATLTKTTGGIVTLSGANTYGGGTSVNGGTLAFGASNVLANSGNVTVAGGVLDIGSFSDTVAVVSMTSGGISGTTGVLTGTSYGFESGTVSAILGGSAGLTKTTNGTVTLSGVNTFSGGTTVNGGVLAYGANNVLADSGIVTVSGGTLDISTFSDSVAAVALTSGTIAGSTGILTGTSYGVQSGTVTAILGGSAALTKTTAGTVTLSGSNTYSGGTTINDGVLALGASNVLADSGVVNVNGGTLNIGSSSDTVGVVNLLSGTITGGSGALTGSSYAVQSGTISANLSGAAALTKTTGGTASINSATSYTGGTNVNSGTLALGASNVLANTGAVNINGGTLNLSTFSDTVGDVTLTNGTIAGTGTLSSSSFSLLNGSVSANLGSGNVTKSTSGSVTLSGASSAVGSVAVSGGTLEIATGADLNAGLVTVSSGATLDVDGFLSSSLGLTVDSGATLKGAGSINGLVTVNGTISPGNSAGTLEIVGGLNLSSTTILNFELLENNQTAGLGFNDLIDVDGNLVLDGTLNVPDASTILNWTTNGTSASPLSWTLFTFTGNIIDNGLQLGNMPSLSGIPAPQQWEIKIITGPGGGGSVNLNAVPEPSAAMLIGGVLAGAACLRRRRVA